MTNDHRDDNRQAVRRLFEQGFNQRSAAAFDELIADAYTDPAGARGADAFKQVLGRLSGAFPDLRYTIDDLVADGDRVAVRWHWTGTHLGAFRGVAPTERAVTNSGAAIFRLEGGRVVAATLETDRLGFLQAIGVVPPDRELFP